MLQIIEPPIQASNSAPKKAIAICTFGVRQRCSQPQGDEKDDQQLKQGMSCGDKRADQPAAPGSLADDGGRDRTR